MAFVKLNNKTFTLVSILVVLLVALVSYLWFDQSKIVYFHDEIIPLDPANAFHDYLSVWRQNVNIGTASAGGIPKLISFLIFDLFTKVGLSIHIIEIIFYISTIFTAGFSMFFLCRYLLGRQNLYANISALFASIFYMTSPFIIEYVWRLNYIITRSWYFALIPALLLAFILFCSSRIKSKKSYFALFAFSASSILISPSFSHPSFFIMAIMTITLGFFIAFFKNKIGIKTLLIKTLILLVIFLILNLYWLVPRYTTFADEYETAESIGTTSVLLQNSQNLSVFRSLFLGDAPSLHDNVKWYSWSGLYENPFFYISGLIIFVIALFSLKTKNKVAMCLGFAFLLVFPFYVGTLEPFGIVKLFLFNHFTFLQAFRDPGKWGFYLLPVLCMMLSFGIYTIIFNSKKWVKIYFIALLILTIGIVSYPYFSLRAIPDKYVYPSAQISIPSDYYELAKVLESNNHNMPILQFPLHGSHNYANWNNGGYKGVDILRNISGQPLLDTNVNSENLQMLKILQQKLSTNSTEPMAITRLMHGIGAKYIIINKDSDASFINNTFTEGILKTLNNSEEVNRVFDSKHLSAYLLKNNNISFIYTAQVNKAIDSKNDYDLVNTTEPNNWQLIQSNEKAQNIDLPLTNYQTKDQSTSQVSYIKNIKPLNIDPYNITYINVNLSSIDKNVSIAVSAEDVTGHSEWLPNVSKQINKNLSTNSAPLENVFSLINFTTNIKTLRVNIVNKSGKSQNISIKSVNDVNGLVNTYNAYTQNDLSHQAYLNNDIVNDVSGHGSIDKISDIKPTSANFTLSGTGKILIASHQQYDKNWKLNFKNSSIKSVDPIPVNADLNGWVVDIDSICTNSHFCTKNNNVYTVNLKIEYIPQKAFIVALYTSLGFFILITIFAILAYVILSLKKV